MGVCVGGSVVGCVYVWGVWGVWGVCMCDIVSNIQLNIPSTSSLSG